MISTAQTVTTVSINAANWLDKALAALATEGAAILQDVIPSAQITETQERMLVVQQTIQTRLGQHRLDAAGEKGVLRLMMQADPYFLCYLEIPEILAVIDSTLSPTAILHLQNGFVFPSIASEEAPSLFQTQFHMDFPRVLNGYLASLNTMIVLSDFTTETGCTWVVPGSHQHPTPPPLEELKRRAVPVECLAGSVILFDSTLYHAAGTNRSGENRFSINHQYTRSFFKQQIDYVRALDDSLIQSQSPRTQQLLGYYARIPTSLEEYYQPEEHRLYRKGQG